MFTSCTYSQIRSELMKTVPSVYSRQTLAETSSARVAGEAKSSTDRLYQSSVIGTKHLEHYFMYVTVLVMTVKKS